MSQRSLLARFTVLIHLYCVGVPTSVHQKTATLQAESRTYNPHGSICRLRRCDCGRRGERP